MAEKSNETNVTRRRFMSDVTAGAALLPATQATAAAQAAAPQGSASAVSQPAYPRTFSGSSLEMIAFPLGGIGAGSVSLGGRGQLRDWEIFNRPDKGNSPKYAFPSIFVQSGDAPPVARVLEARIQPPYTRQPSGLGFQNVPGLPRLQAVSFSGAFPTAQLQFDDPDLAVSVSLEAFTPFIPLDADASGLPVAVLRYRVVNPGPASANVSIAFSIDNPVGQAQDAFRAGGPEGRSNEYRGGPGLAGLLMRNPFLDASAPLAGSFALCVLDPGDAKLTYWRGWPQVRWPWTGALLFWDDFSSDGALDPEPSLRDTVGSICLQRQLAPRAEGVYTFLLSWHFPNRTPERCGWRAPKGQEKSIIGNHYASRFGDAWQAAEYAATRLPDLERRTQRFVAAMRNTTLPPAVVEAAMSNLSTLVAPTCFRTADGSFYGFEGCNDDSGCCFGSCTHVWNYEMATAFVFPTLSRSFREGSFGPRTDQNGRMDFRQLLPDGAERYGLAAADGQMGQIIRLYLDWRLSGDTAWLRKLWPNAKRALEFAWIPGGWDADRDGVMEGVQHNTYDVEFFGPNPLCGVWYLGALRAAEEMATAVGETEAAAEYRRLFSSGSQWIDANLFNGEFYIQKIGRAGKEKIAEGLTVGMGAADPENPDFQLGEGCLVDQLVGQYCAHVAGLGPLLEQENIRKTLESIYRYNYKRSLYRHEAVQRVYALNDEAGLVICDYGRGKRPRIPFPYFGEIMTGFEYSAAILMLYEGMPSEGAELIENIRRRYDGVRRNPWDEAECGHHYARAMASWAAIPALSGFLYHGAENSLAVRPQLDPQSFSCFWSTAGAWGDFSQSGSEKEMRFSLNVTEGQLPIRTVELLPATEAAVTSVAAIAEKSVPHELRRSGQAAVFHFSEPVVLQPGESLLLSLSAGRKAAA